MVLPLFWFFTPCCCDIFRWLSNTVWILIQDEEVCRKIEWNKGRVPIIFSKFPYWFAPLIISDLKHGKSCVSHFHGRTILSFLQRFFAALLKSIWKMSGWRAKDNPKLIAWYTRHGQKISDSNLNWRQRDYMSPTTDKKVDSGLLSMHFWLSTVNLIWRWLSSFETYANDFQVINWLKKGTL